MSTLYSWLGGTDYRARKQDDQGCALVSMALREKPYRVLLLWGDGPRTPLAERDEFLKWFHAQLHAGGCDAEVDVREIAGADDRVMEFAWVWGQVEAAMQGEREDEGDCINASSGTPVMTAVWIVRKKALGSRARLLISSKEQGVQPLALPPALSISLTDLISVQPSRLLKRLLSGETRLLAQGFEHLVGDSVSIKEIKLRAQQAARYPFPVLLTGPAGSGKSALAEAIHAASPRNATGRLVAVDCGTLVGERALGELFGWERGAFTGADKPFLGRYLQASGGTLFLDEVGNLPPMAQQLFLRTLQSGFVQPVGGIEEKKADTRIIAATNTDLRAAVQKGAFRQDLLDRLSRLTIRMPGLAERREDIMPIAERFLDVFNREHRQAMENDGVVWPKRFASGVDRVLRAHTWPGNVRELEHVVTRAILQTAGASTDEITVPDVQDAIARSDLAGAAADGVTAVALGSGFNLEHTLASVRRQFFERALDEAGGIHAKAANLLGISRPTFVRQAKELGVVR
ncbi:MAG: sigma 54-interacting transcriptional regulator [Phycisphaerales bacterium]